MKSFSLLAMGNSVPMNAEQTAAKQATARSASMPSLAENVKNLNQRPARKPSTRVGRLLAAVSRARATMSQFFRSPNPGSTGFKTYTSNDAEQRSARGSITSDSREPSPSSQSAGAARFSFSETSLDNFSHKSADSNNLSETNWNNFSADDIDSICSTKGSNTIKPKRQEDKLKQQYSEAARVLKRIEKQLIARETIGKPFAADTASASVGALSVQKSKTLIHSARVNLTKAEPRDKGTPHLAPLKTAEYKGDKYIKTLFPLGREALFAYKISLNQSLDSVENEQERLSKKAQIVALDKSIFELNTAYIELIHHANKSA